MDIQKNKLYVMETKNTNIEVLERLGMRRAVAVFIEDIL